jgi:hypothetical protein
MDKHSTESDKKDKDVPQTETAGDGQKTEDKTGKI